MVLRRLTAAPRTRQDLREDLLRRNVPPEVADQVLDRFTDVGLIDDSAFARMWVESRQRSRGTAAPVLRQELRAKGVPAEDIEQALGDGDPELDRQRARDLVARRLASTARLDGPARMRRLVGMLVRRGYSSSLAYGVVRELLADDLAEREEPVGPDGETPWRDRA